VRICTYYSSIWYMPIKFMK